MMIYLRFKEYEDSKRVDFKEDMSNFYVGEDAQVNVKFNGSTYEIRVTGSYLDEEIIFNNCTDLNTIICVRDDVISHSLYSYFENNKIPDWLNSSLIVDTNHHGVDIIFYTNDNDIIINNIISQEDHTVVWANTNPLIDVCQSQNGSDLYDIDIKIKSDMGIYVVELLNCDLHKVYPKYQDCLLFSLHSYATFESEISFLHFADGIREKIKEETKEVMNDSMLELEEKQPDMNQITQMVLNNADRLYYLLEEYNDAKNELARIETEIKSVLTGGDK